MDAPPWFSGTRFSILYGGCLVLWGAGGQIRAVTVNVSECIYTEIAQDQLANGGPLAHWQAGSIYECD